jgi:broad specificity phosphatase PhoE
LADLVGKTVETKTELDEHGANEKFAAVDLRVHRFLHWWTTDGDPLVIISSHGDIIPLMAYHLLGASLDVKKGSWLEIEWSSGQAHLLWFIRHFKDFF